MTTIKQHGDGTTLVISKAFASFPVLIKPKLNDLNDDMEFGVDVLFSKDTDMTEFEKVIAKVKFDKWGRDVPAFKYQFLKDGDAHTDKEGNLREGYAGMWFITVKSKEDKPPVVIDLAGNDITREDGIVGGDVIDAF